MSSVQGGLRCDVLQLPGMGEIQVGDRATIYLAGPLYGVKLNARVRLSLAQMNAGYTLLGAIPKTIIRINDITAIAIGGSLDKTADATGFAVYGTQSGSSVALFTVLNAAATQSAVCRPGTTNTSVLADGASFSRNDINTAITCKAVTAGNYDLITTTYFDIILDYCVEV
jgi:hypothetical protein